MQDQDLDHGGTDLVIGWASLIPNTSSYLRTTQLIKFDKWCEAYTIYKRITYEM